MATNFEFLKKVNNDLYEIISEAEKLYRDEYFEQCMVQTRRFGEHVCKDMLVQNGKRTGSFDDMLATLKDHSQGNPQEKEFIDDLYFLKKNGNQSVHSGKVKKEAIVALECLQRSFEVAINYSVYNQGASTNILKLDYDVELLVTDKKSKKSLKEKYLEEKKKQEKIEKKEKQLVTKPERPQKIKQEKVKKKEVVKQQKSKQKTKIQIPLFWKFIIFLSCISVGFITFLIITISFQTK
ncbi:MAG: DUF4145 domain-containing protein [Candidatus Gastranaerophilales bacterium]|nr:DUF4145 domain-containing protein [Candidatus Gastranaerophilales bacterium]